MSEPENNPKGRQATVADLVAGAKGFLKCTDRLQSEVNDLLTTLNELNRMMSDLSMWASRDKVLTPDRLTKIRDDLKKAKTQWIRLNLSQTVEIIKATEGEAASALILADWAAERLAKGTNSHE